VHQESDPEAMATADLVKELAADSSLLVKRQLELAKLEVKSELEERVSIWETLGLSGVMAYAGVLMLLVAAAAAIGSAIGHGLWSGALIVAAVLMAPAAIVGSSGYRQLKSTGALLQRSRAELDKEIEWTKTLTTT
jgi:uncharacterized membrane protein YqjE